MAHPLGHGERMDSDDRPAPEVPTHVLLGSFIRSGQDPLHELIRGARSGDEDAVDRLLNAVRDAAGSAWGDIADAVVVAVPGHLEGGALGLVTAMARVVAEARGWSVATDDLGRARAVGEAKAGDARDTAAELESLAWRAGAASSAEVIVLVDDVVRTGETLRACVAAIRAAGDPRRVVAVVAAQAEFSTGD